MVETKKPTPAQRVKELETEIKKLEASILKLTDYTATYGNEQYTLGFDEGYNQAKIELAVAKADAGIARFFRK
jgi:hypothetical protein